jgi:hypothetical protein
LIARRLEIDWRGHVEALDDVSGERNRPH